MRKHFLVALSVCLAAGLAAPGIAQAQEDEEPETRYITVTSFDVPFGERDKVFPYMINRVLPATQLNPNVLNFRVLLHNWGSDAADVVIVAEYENIEDIHSDCGQPCDDYYDANPAPEEGDEGYAEYQEAQEAFSKYYGHHSDEIYLSPMSEAVVEGQMRTGPGLEPEQEEEM